MGNSVTLSNGHFVKEEELQIEQVRNELPRFVSIAVGCEENKWYVQTTDTHVETYLSHPIAEGLETKEQAMEIAENLSIITGMSIQVWNKGE